MPMNAREEAQLDRLGFHDDCFLSDGADMGTYDQNSWLGWFDVSVKRSWVTGMRTASGADKFVGGETCDSAGDDDAAVEWLWPRLLSLPDMSFSDRLSDAPEELLQLMQREAGILQLADPLHLTNCRRRVQPEAPFGTMHRPEQAELLVQVKCPHGLPGALGKLAHPQRFF